MRGYTDLRKSPVLRRMRGYAGYTESASGPVLLFPILLKSEIKKTFGSKKIHFEQQYTIIAQLSKYKAFLPVAVRTGQ